MNSYEAKQEARRARLERASERAGQESDRASEAARGHTKGIEFGQPILVGHHSEKRHRGAIAKSDRAMRRSVEAYKRSEELARRAASVGTGGISSDDPEALEKLADKRTELEQERDNMKAANVAYRKRDDVALVTATGKGLAWWDIELTRLHSWDRKPYPAYSLTNIGARIRQAAKRTKHIEQVATLEATTETYGVATVQIDPDDNRVNVKFPAKLSRDDYKAMRSRGFVWSPTRGAFTRKLSSAAIYYGREMAQKIGTAAE